MVLDDGTCVSEGRGGVARDVPVLRDGMYVGETLGECDHMVPMEHLLHCLFEMRVLVHRVK